MSITVVAEAPSNRVLANRRNAAKSTGPRTVEGKAVSRRNAVKHGLAGRGTVLPAEIEQEADARAAEWVACVRPKHRFQAELITLAARTYTQIDHGWKGEHLARARVVDRAETAWDLERDGAIAEIARHLSDEPARTLAKLRQTAHGTAWLYEQWEMIARRLEAGDNWSEETRSYALDLLGVPSTFRDQYSPLDWPELMPDDEESNDPDDDHDEQRLANLAEIRARRLAIAREQLDQLSQALDYTLIDLDEDDRALRMANVMVMPDVDVSRFVRYQQFHTKRFMEMLPLINLNLDGTATRSVPSPSAPLRPDLRPQPELRPQAVEPRLPLGPAMPATAFEPPRKREPLQAVTAELPATCEQPEPNAEPAHETKPTEPRPVTYGQGILLPREFYSMNLEELKLAAWKVNGNDPEQVESYRLLLRGKLIENEIRNGR